MSNVRNMIEAATSNNPAEFEKYFVAETTEILGRSLEEMRADTYRKILGLSEDDKECDNDEEDNEKNSEDEDGDENDTKDNED